MTRNVGVSFKCLGKVQCVSVRLKEAKGVYGEKVKEEAKRKLSAL